MVTGRIRPVNIDDEMQESYLSYAMSVIVSRALPDVRDGLKPVHRRILYAMYDMRLGPTSAHKKSARIVGEVLGKYHPHGDQAVYDAMTRMAQGFSMRYTLVDGQGNFGSIDGDTPAAMRYTEARLQELASEMLTDISKDTVDFAPNFDDTMQEPTVLPAAVPNLLVNGSTGIAVGMSTSIPPHNISEVCNALTFMLKNWMKNDNIQIEDLMDFIPGPDFPTGGLIVSSNTDDTLASAYGSGRGKITTRAKVHVEEIGRGRNQLIVTELPYQTNKSALIERIADLVRDGKIEGVADLRDESDRQGMRIVMELNKIADPDHVLRRLFKLTALETTFSIILLALSGGEPRVLNLKQTLRLFLDHRLEIVERRSKFDLEHAKERSHILEGLLVALKNLDKAIQMIRNAKDSSEARNRLMKRFKLSQRQANAILETPLRRLARLEQNQLRDEYKQVKKEIKRLDNLLRSPKKMREVISQELDAIKNNYGDRRRTDIVATMGDRSPVTSGDLVLDEQVWVVITKHGKIAKVADNRRPAVGRHAPLALLRVNTRDTLYLFTDRGECAALHVHTIATVDDPSKGPTWDSVSALASNDKIIAAVGLPPAARESSKRSASGVYLFLSTHMGTVKKVKVSDLPGPSSHTFSVMNVAQVDTLIAACLIYTSSDVLLVTSHGQAIRFSAQQVRPMGLGAAGVQGVKLGSDNDRVVAMNAVQSDADVLLVAESGEANRTTLTEFPTKGRYGKGVRAWKTQDRTRITGAVIGQSDSIAILLTSKGKARAMKLDKAPRLGRPAKGRSIVQLEDKEIVARVIPCQEPFIVKTKGHTKQRTAKTKNTPRAATKIKGTATTTKRKPSKSRTQKNTSK